MPRKAKKADKPVVVQSAVEITIKATLPITEGYEVNDINEYVNDINQGNNSVEDIFTNFYYVDAKAKANLTVLEKEIPVQEQKGEVA